MGSKNNLYYSNICLTILRIHTIITSIIHVFCVDSQLFYKILSLLKQKTSQDPEWKLAEDAGGGTVINSVIKDTKPKDKEDKGKNNSSELHKYFSNMIPKDVYYQINKNAELLELVIGNNGNYITYCIDPDIVIGNGYNILANIPDNNIFVNLKHKDIVSKVVKDKAYIMTPEEIAVVREDMFTNEGIYNFVDMSGMSGNISKLTKEEFSKLGKKLTGILNIDMIAIHNKVPRMRFKEFISVDDFTLVSDYDCIAPIPNASLEVHEGLIIKVKDGDFIVDLNDGGDVVTYTMNYNVM